MWVNIAQGQITITFEPAREKLWEAVKRIVAKARIQKMKTRWDSKSFERNEGNPENVEMFCLPVETQ